MKRKLFCYILICSNFVINNVLSQCTAEPPEWIRMDIRNVTGNNELNGFWNRVPTGIQEPFLCIDPDSSDFNTTLWGRCQEYGNFKTYLYKLIGTQYYLYYSMLHKRLNDDPMQSIDISRSGPKLRVVTNYTTLCSFNDDTDGLLYYTSPGPETILSNDFYLMDNNPNYYTIRPFPQPFWQYSNGTKIEGSDGINSWFICTERSKDTVFQGFDGRPECGAFFFTSPTQEPTLSPSLNPSISPSLSPTESPSLSPSISPSMSPSLSPTLNTSAPSLSPTIPTELPSLAPTKKPTPLPTIKETIFNEPACPILIIDFLDQVLPKSQSINIFRVINNTFYSGRRIWSNSNGVEVFYSDRFNPNGNWIITNNSYILIDVNVTNINRSLPGVDAEAYFHYPLNDPHLTPETPITILFNCIETAFPTVKPSNIPTNIPTVSPIENNCLELDIYYNDDNCGDKSIKDIYVGKYVREIHPFFINETTRYIGIGDISTKIFQYTTFNKWGLYDLNNIRNNDETSDVYWMLQNEITFNKNRPILNNGDKTLFNVYYDSTAIEICDMNLTIICQNSLSPTMEPTKNTDIPSISPTMAPTSLSPTKTPTMSPSTTNPTSSPTQICNEIRVTGTDNFDESYTYRFNPQNQRNEYQSVSSDNIIYFTKDTRFFTWIMLSRKTDTYWLSDEKPSHQPPKNSIWRRYSGNTYVVDDVRTLNLECFVTVSPTSPPSLTPTLTPSITPTQIPSATPSMTPSSTPSGTPTKSPTMSPIKNTTTPSMTPSMSPVKPTMSPTLTPSFSPTLTPTQTPTSSCNGLLFENLADSNYIGNQWFQRQYTFEINNNVWWKSLDGKLKIAIQSGYWSLIDIYTNKVILFTTVFDNKIFTPPRAVIWQTIDAQVSVGISCSDTFAPSKSPSITPSISPTEFIFPIWDECDSFQFSFIEQSTNIPATFWKEPVLNSQFNFYDIIITPNITQGSPLSRGEYSITYQAGNTSSVCIINLFVIGQSPSNNVQLCQENNYHIELIFDSDNNVEEISKELIDTETEGIDIDGVIYLQNGQVCYISGLRTSNNRQTFEQSTFLGIKTYNIIWEALIIIIVILIICLLLDRILRCFKCNICKLCKRNPKNDDESGAALLPSQEPLENVDSSSQIISGKQEIGDEQIPDESVVDPKDVNEPIPQAFGDEPMPASSVDVNDNNNDNANADDNNNDNDNDEVNEQNEDNADDNDEPIPEANNDENVAQPNMDNPAIELAEIPPMNNDDDNMDNNMDNNEDINDDNNNDNNDNDNNAVNAAETEEFIHLNSDVEIPPAAFQQESVNI